MPHCSTPSASGSQVCPLMEGCLSSLSSPSRVQTCPPGNVGLLWLSVFPQQRRGSPAGSLPPESGSSCSSQDILAEVGGSPRVLPTIQGAHIRCFSLSLACAGTACPLKPDTVQGGLGVAEGAPQARRGKETWVQVTTFGSSCDEPTQVGCWQEKGSPAPHLLCDHGQSASSLCSSVFSSVKWKCNSTHHMGVIGK